MTHQGMTNPETRMTKEKQRFVIPHSAFVIDPFHGRFVSFHPDSLA